MQSLNQVFIYLLQNLRLIVKTSIQYLNALFCTFSSCLHPSELLTLQQAVKITISIIQ